jgi:hypothetical protein
VYGVPKGKTVDGFETPFGTNHLGHFVLVNRIASLFKFGSRLINLSPAGHRYANVDPEDPNFLAHALRRVHCLRPPKQRAATSVWAACVADAGAIGGRNCGDCHVAEVVSTPGLFGDVRPYALDPQRAQVPCRRAKKLSANALTRTEGAQAHSLRRRYVYIGIKSAACRERNGRGAHPAYPSGGGPPALPSRRVLWAS